MCYSQGYQQTKENISIIGHRQICDAIVYWCLLLFSPPLVVYPPSSLHHLPSLLNSSFCILCSIVISPTVPCLFTVPLRWREWKLASDHCWPAAIVHYRALRSAAPLAQSAGSWKWLSVYLERLLLHIHGLSQFTQSIKAKPLSTCLNFQNDYCRTWTCALTPFPWPFLHLSHLSSHLLLINTAIEVQKRGLWIWTDTLTAR